MKKNEIMLVGVDIHKFVEELCNRFLSESHDMTDGEKKAYNLGIENTLGLLKQTTEELFDNGIVDYDQYLVHVPGLEVITEFGSIKDIQNKSKAD